MSGLEVVPPRRQRLWIGARPTSLTDAKDRAATRSSIHRPLLTEPNHHRRRKLARLAVERRWSVRQLEAEITSKPAPRRRGPAPDRCAAATRLQEALVSATGCGVCATPHRYGFQIILDRPARRAFHVSSLAISRTSSRARRALVTKCSTCGTRDEADNRPAANREASSASTVSAQDRASRAKSRDLSSSRRSRPEGEMNA